MATVEKQKVGRPKRVKEMQEKQLAREFLEDTADFLEGHWTRGTLHDESGNHCAVGGMLAVSSRKKYRGTGVYHRAKKLLAAKIGIFSMGSKSLNNAIYLWNDSPSMSEQEVVRKFREASADK